MPSVSQVNWTQLLVGGTLGVILTFLLARGLEIVRNRPRLDIRLQDPMERLYVEDVGERGSTRLVVCEPTNPNAQLVITLQLLCLNRSYQSDGVVAAELSAPNIGWTAPVRGRVRADEPFSGLNVGAHSIESIRLRFFIFKMSHDGSRGYGEFPLWTEDPLPDLSLRVEAVHRATWLRRRAGRPNTSVAVAGGSIRRTHREGIGSLEITYLTKAPAAAVPPVRLIGLGRILRVLKR